MRVGIGYDSHRLAEGRRLVIGGIVIPFEKGLLGHSDADVLCHAIMDAVIGAVGLGDIGRLFPDTDPRWKDAVSTELLRYVVDLARMNGYAIAWIDATIIAERPKISSFIEEMKSALSGAGIPAGMINIKAKTNEGMGFIGRGEGIAAQAICLLSRI
jgi:2-C-methyl-D-erythritol 2,4-cyclodiphosphate synthase